MLDDYQGRKRTLMWWHALAFFIVVLPFERTQVKEVQESFTPPGKAYRWQGAALMALQV